MPLPLTVRHATGAYAVRFGPLEELGAAVREAGLSGRCVVVTDANVGPRYAAPAAESLRAAGLEPHVLTVPPGEASKSTERLGWLYDQTLPLGVDRGTAVLALGGGVVGDLAGFLAATLLRGVPFVQVPTTTIAQIDSAIGGKTGVNHAAGKNLIGAFWPPRLVYADPATLATLPPREYVSGLAEAVKHALIDGGELLGLLLGHADALLRMDAGAAALVAPRAAAVKCAVVSADERESGRRAFLNLGHTFGHALETTLGYGAVTHGEAVALGMRAALHLSERLHGPIGSDAWQAVGLIPTPDIALPPVSELLAVMRRDKKNTAGRIRLVLLRALGEPYLTDAATDEQIADAFEAAAAPETSRQSAPM